MNKLEDYFHVLDLKPNYCVFSSENDATDFVETVMKLIDAYLKENPAIFSEEDFLFTVFDDVKQIVMCQFADHTFMDFETELDLEDMYEDAFRLYCETFLTENHLDLFDDENDSDVEGFSQIDLELLQKNYEELAKKVEPVDPIKERIENAIWKIRGKPQPEQRTAAWYEFRHNLITASNAWKALDSQAQQNSLIYEKCQPMKTFESDPQNSFVNVNSSLHWGQKYEPLSVLIYEKLNNTEVEDFGCIQHDTYKFLGASPDGIITDHRSPKFGRMLEIKNVVSREITGIPKKEYWVQMQLQMEVCDLDDCDFLETKFLEYANIDEFLLEPDPKKTRGIIMYFQTPEGKPHYIYKILDDFDKRKIEAWQDEMIESHQTSNEKKKMSKKTWIHNYYWRLEVYSCVLVNRDRVWFESNIGKIADIWAIIEKERVAGYEHRAPKKRVVKETVETVQVKKPIALLNIIKLQQQKREENN